MICVVIARTRHRMIQAEIEEAAKRGARMIELRLDFLAKAPDFKRLLEKKPCPLIATVRRQPDGGRWSGTEAARRTLLRQAVVGGFDWIDLETDVADEIRRFKDVKRIVSYHNVEGVPDDLEKIYKHMCGQDPDVVKIAVTAEKPADNLRVLKLLQNPPKPTVALCMGEVGLPTRILGARYGTPFTYAAFNKERVAAPGLLSVDELQKIYHYDKINAQTEVYGVVGDPVGHSLSPFLHNATFRKTGVNAVYVPFLVERGQFPDFLKNYDQVPVRGYSVTIPHKEAAVAAAKQQDAGVSVVRAANTLVRGPEGFAAYNTDFQAARESLLAHLAARGGAAPATLKDKVVLILGAGGVARAVAHALKKEGAIVTITNRTLDRAKKLAEEVGCRFEAWEARLKVLCEILVNCTSVGMHPNVDEMPIHPSFLNPKLVVFDTVYTPERTMLVKEARERGCHVLTGVDMFVRQAALQFHLFTGRQAPFEAMLQTLRRAITPVRDTDEP